MHDSRMCRILAVVVRSGRFGYAAFETPAQLLDFGVSKFDSRAQARTRIRNLLKKFHPSVVVVDNGGRGATQHKWRTSIVRMIGGQLRRMSVPVAVISARELRAFFRQHGKTNKYDFAVVAAAWFPELACRLQVKRKWYDPEPWVMTFFDAIALGTAYLAKQNPDSAESFRRPSVA